MGAIKDLVELVKELETRAKDRAMMDIVHKIQTIVLSVQSHQAETLERSVQLIQENADLKKQLAEANSEEIRIHDGIELRRGQRTGGKWLPFCPKCGMPAQDAYLTNGRGKIVVCTAACGWQVFEKRKLEAVVSEFLKPEPNKTNLGHE